jgi:iduronate 2-sulfatase
VELYDDVMLPPIPHPGKPAGKTTWHGSGEFMKYNRWKKDPRNDEEFATLVRKHYAGCVSYADAQVGRILDHLRKNGLADNTIIVLWGDHGWHLGEHAIWGKHSLFEESLRSPLLICAPAVVNAGTATKSVVETIDLYPTLCDLTGLPKPEGLDGVSLLPLLADPAAAGHGAVSYQAGRETLRTDRHRLIRHAKAGKATALELYDHENKDGETRNLAADNPDLAADLCKQLDAKLN